MIHPQEVMASLKITMFVKMILNNIDNYYLQKDEPIKSCLMALREYILSYDDNITEAWKYGMPFFCYKDKMFCYLWIDKKTHQPYIGIVEGGKVNHPKLIQGNRSRMKILMIDQKKDLPIATIDAVFRKALVFYSSKK